VYLFHDTCLFAKICRVLRKLLKVYREGIVIQDVMHFGKKKLRKKKYLEKIPLDVEEIIVNTLLPSFSLIPSNCGLSSELWGVFHQLSYKLRYKFYGYWKNALYDKHSELSLQRVHTINRTKYFRKRISGARAKECGRLLVKISLNNPLIAFDLLLDQVQVFDNMIVPVVDSMKYMSQLSLDCMSFILITRLSDPTKTKLKDDGLNESHWFQSLTSFAGDLYRKYPDLDIVPILQYAINSLKDEDSLDLLILNELISNMTGLEAIDEMAKSQMEGLSGGRTLEAQTATIQQEDDRTTSTQSLLSLLIREQFVFPLFALMSQQKSQIVYRTETHYVKMIGELFDKCHGVLCQFIKLVSNGIESDTIYSNLFPSLYSLCVEHRIPPADAFMIHRRCIHLPRISICPEPKEEEGQEMEDDVDPLVKACRHLLPSSTWSAISPEFYAIFWSMSMYDLHIPKQQYAEQIKKCRKLVAEIDSASKLDEEKQKEKEAHLKVAQKLKEEFILQSKNFQVMKIKLGKQKDTWLAKVVDRNLTVTRFLQYCIFPRCFASGIDALYCAKFIDTIHNLGTPWFSVIHFYDQITKSMIPLICSCTANEATRFGQFLKEILRPLHTWKRSKKSYEEECMTKASFAIDFYKPHGERLSFPKFLLIVQRWHKVITKVFSTCLSSNIRMQIGNALLILTQIGSVYPRISTHGEHLEKLLTRIVNDPQHKKSAIKVLATRSHAILCSEKKHWVSEREFAPSLAGKEKPAKKKVATKTPAAKSATKEPKTPSSLVKSGKITVVTPVKKKKPVKASLATKLKLGQPSLPPSRTKVKTVQPKKLKSGIPAKTKTKVVQPIISLKTGKPIGVKKETVKVSKVVLLTKSKPGSKNKAAEASANKKRSREVDLDATPVGEKSIKINASSSPSSGKVGDSDANGARRKIDRKNEIKSK